MKLLKYILFSLCALSTVVVAQPHDPDRRMQRHFNMLVNKLQLNDTQIDQMKALHERYRPQMEQIREADLDREEKREQFRMLKDKQDEELRTILTDEQFEKFMLMKEKRQKRKMRGGRNGEERGGEYRQRQR